MYRLEFTRAYDYLWAEESVSVPVVLRAGGNEVPVSASVDTGASFCVFGAEIASSLGLDLTSGIRLRFRTANSTFDAYGHEVEINSLGVTVLAVVYFFADPAIDTNVLGRTGWLDRVRMGLIHHDNRIYLAPYDTV